VIAGGRKFTVGRRDMQLGISGITRGSVVLLAVAVAFCVEAEAGALPKPRSVRISGWVSDAACGADHTKPGGGSCVKKCIAGGASIGHPEWKPQKMVLVDDANKYIWIVQNPDALEGYEGRRVRLSGFLNPKKRKLKVVTVESVVE
jgi:hypothetical protein